MTSVLQWEAPVANAIRAPAPWTDAACVVLLGMADRLGAGLPVVVLATRRTLGDGPVRAMGWRPGSLDNLDHLDPVFKLEALYAFWCRELEVEGREPPELEVDAAQARAAVLSDPVLSVVYARALAIAELPEGVGGQSTSLGVPRRDPAVVVPTFSSVMGAIRDDWRALTGRDLRVSPPEPHSDSSALAGLAVLGLGWYLWRHT